MKIVGLLTLSIIAIVLSACGGKVDTQNNPALTKPSLQTEAPLPDQRELEPQKADIGVVRTLLRTLDLSSISRAGYPNGTGVNGHIRQLTSSLLKPGLSQLQQLLVAGKSSHDIDFSKPCKISGDVLITGILAGDRLVTGDQLTVDFNSCNNSNNLSSGSVTMTVMDGPQNQEFGTPDFSIGLDFSGYTVDSGKSVQLNGRSTLTQSRHKRAKVVKIQGPSLSVTTDSGSLGLVNYELSEFSDLRNQLSSFAVSGTVYSDNLSGGFNVDTLEAFVQSSWDPYPSQGVLLLESIDKPSSLLLTVLDNTNIQLEIDNDGDGQVDESVINTWQQALPPYAYF